MCGCLMCPIIDLCFRQGTINEFIRVCTSQEDIRMFGIISYQSLYSGTSEPAYAVAHQP